MKNYKDNLIQIKMADSTSEDLLQDFKTKLLLLNERVY